MNKGEVRELQKLAQEVMDVKPRSAVDRLCKAAALGVLSIFAARVHVEILPEPTRRSRKVRAGRAPVARTRPAKKSKPARARGPR